jgi:sphingomyelin phosphodiesterase
VYIIGHIPPNNNLNDWAVRYNALMDRYAYTVRSQFFGHTHNDHLAFHHGSLQKDKIVNYYLVAPSLTTYDYRVPRYRIVDVDFDTL